jgi:prolipoprotein diacylglyceryltransferase
VFNPFSVIIGLGASLGLGLVVMRAPPQRAASQLNTGLWILLGALIGARAGYVAANWAYFQAHALDIPQVWLGGLSWAGAAAGGLLSLALIALLYRRGLGSLADEMVPLALLLMLSAWLGAWESGTAYGSLLPQVWWAAPTVDEWGAWAMRVPLQPIGALSALVILGLVDRLRSRLRQPGEAAGLAWLGIALTTFGLSFLRADPAQLWRGWRLDSWAALVLTGLAFLFCLAAFWPRHPEAII